MVELPAVTRWMALITVAVGLIACAPKPVRIDVKGPKNSLRAKYGETSLPVFKEKNATVKLRAIAYGEGDVFMGTAEVRWKSQDPSVASVSQSGLVTVLSSGKTVVEAVTKGEPKLEGSIDIVSLIIGSVEIVEPELQPGEVPKLPMGEVLQFSAVVKNDRGEVVDVPVTWESTTYAATVTVDGKVEGRAIGNTTIMASEPSGETADIEIEVTDWPKKKKRRRRR